MLIESFFAFDAFPVNAGYNKYIPICSLYNEDTFSPNQPSGTVINVACFIRVDGNPVGGAYINIGAIHQQVWWILVGKFIMRYEFAP